MNSSLLQTLPLSTCTQHSWQHLFQKIFYAFKAVFFGGSTATITIVKSR